jgi:hypothetical protein
MTAFSPHEEVFQAARSNAAMPGFIFPLVNSPGRVFQAGLDLELKKACPNRVAKAGFDHNSLT